MFTTVINKTKFDPSFNFENEFNVFLKYFFIIGTITKFFMLKKI